MPCFAITCRILCHAMPCHATLGCIGFMICYDMTSHYLQSAEEIRSLQLEALIGEGSYGSPRPNDDVTVIVQCVCMYVCMYIYIYIVCVCIYIYIYITSLSLSLSLYIYIYTYTRYGMHRQTSSLGSSPLDAQRSRSGSMNNSVSPWSELCKMG